MDLFNYLLVRRYGTGKWRDMAFRREAMYYVLEVGIRWRSCAMCYIWEVGIRWRSHATALRSRATAAFPKGPLTFPNFLSRLCTHVGDLSGIRSQVSLRTRPFQHMARAKRADAAVVADASSCVSVSESRARDQERRDILVIRLGNVASITGRATQENASIIMEALRGAADGHQVLPHRGQQSEWLDRRFLATQFNVGMHSWNFCKQCLKDEMHLGETQAWVRRNALKINV